MMAKPVVREGEALGEDIDEKHVGVGGGELSSLSQSIPLCSKLRSRSMLDKIILLFRCLAWAYASTLERAMDLFLDLSGWIILTRV